jgi:hypothetical protein
MPRSAQDWLEEIDAALEYREQFAQEASWYKLEADYANDPTGDTAVGANLVHSIGDSLTASLMVPSPEFVVTPERRSAVDKAPVVEALDNYLMRKLCLKRHVNTSALHGFLFNRMILKIGYDSEFGYAPFYDVGRGGQLLGLTLTQFDKRGRRIETPSTQPGMPWVRSVLPHDFVVPWGTIDLEDAPWCAHRVVRHVSAVRADPKYRNTTGLRGEISMEDFVETYLKVGSKRSDVHAKRRRAGAYEPSRKPEFIELWEIRDRLEGKIIVVTRSSTEFLRNETDAMQLACGMPFVSATLNPGPRSFWHTPPAYYLGAIQKEEYDVALQSTKQRRISILKFLYRSDAIKKAELERLLSGDVGAAAGINAAMPLNEIIAPLQTGSNLDFVMQSENNRRNAREAVGFSRNQLGEYDASSRRTAREATFVAQGSQLRVSKQNDAVSDLYCDAIDKVNDCCWEFWRTPREVLRDEGWSVFTGPDLKEDYLYDVDLAFKRQVSRAQRKVEALAMMPQMLQTAAALGMPLQQVLRWVQNASGDAAFSAMLGMGGRGAGAAPGALPAIPATQNAQPGA